jgi:hypothetical protein
VSKAVLVMDMPKNCFECKMCYVTLDALYCVAKKNMVTDSVARLNRRQKFCPIKPLPQKQPLTFLEHGQDAIAMGWNACLEEIEKEST